MMFLVLILKTKLANMSLPQNQLISFVSKPIDQTTACVNELSFFGSLSIACYLVMAQRLVRVLTYLCDPLMEKAVVGPDWTTD